MRLLILFLLFSLGLNAQKYESRESALFPNVFVNKFIPLEEHTEIELTSKTATFFARGKTLFIVITTPRPTISNKSGGYMVSWNATASRDPVVIGYTFSANGRLNTIGILQNGVLLVFIVYYKPENI